MRSCELGCRSDSECGADEQCYMPDSGVSHCIKKKTVGSAWGSTCQDFSDYFGTIYDKVWGCTGPENCGCTAASCSDDQMWWCNHGCKTAPAKSGPYPACLNPVWESCQEFSDYFGTNYDKTWGCTGTSCDCTKPASCSNEQRWWCKNKCYTA